MSLANIIVSAQEKENIVFLPILHKYKAYFMLCKYRLLWHILFYLYFLYMQPKGQKIQKIFHFLLKYVVVVPNHVLLSPLVRLM